MIFDKVRKDYGKDYMIVYFIFSWPIVAVTNANSSLKRIQLSPGKQFLMLNFFNRVFWIKIKS